MSYINDPREMAIKPKDGVILEQDNRSETMYHWGAMVTDLCDLPVSEYMKPMTVIVLGSGGEWPEPDTGVTSVEDIKIWFTVLKDGNPITDEAILGASENENITWSAQWQWLGNFPGTIQVAASIKTDKGQYSISATLQDNATKKKTIELTDIMNDGSTVLESYSSYGVGSNNVPSDEIVNNPTYSESLDGVKYNFQISTDETIICLTLKGVISGSTVYINNRIKFGDILELSTINTEKEGYNFIGWFDSKGKEYKDGDKMPAQNLTLTGKYEIKNFVVKFVFDYGNGEIEEISSTTVNYGSKVSSFPNTTKTGYKFLGWNPSTSTVITEDTTFIANFEILTYTVEWSGYSTGVITQTYNHGDALILPDSPEKEGYTFLGWTPEVKDIVTANAKYTAKFSVNSYTIDYFVEINGELGTPISSITVTYGSTIPSKGIFVENGYTYTPWVGYNAETGEEFNGAKMPAFNLKYVSVKTTNEYLLSYFDNGELVKEDTYLYGEIIIPYTYEKIGWTVSEWENLPVTMPYYNVSAHCVSTINQYKVTFNDKNGALVSEVLADYGTLIKDIVPEVEGYSYEVSEEILNTTVGTEPMIIVGELIAKNYNVTITVNGVDTLIELPFGSNIREFVNANYPAEEGYYAEIEMTSEFVPANNDTKVIVTFIANVWTLSYQTIGGAEGENIMGSVQVSYGETILDKLPTKEIEGYNFNGWTIEGVEIQTGDTMPNNDIMVIGTYTIKDFNVIVKDGDIEILSSRYTFGTKISDIVNEPSVLEYIDTLIYSGYNVNFDIDLENEVKSDIVINIVKVEKEFILTFMNGDTVISTSSVKVNSIINYPIMDNYEEDGVEYVFAWDDVNYNGQPMPPYDLTIRGQYNAKAESPIYYGAYVTSATTANEMTFDSNNMGEYFKTATVSELLADEGKFAPIFVPADEYLCSSEGQNLSDREWDAYCNARVLAHCWLLPLSVIEKYNFRAFVTNEGYDQDLTIYSNDLTIDGVEYKLYIFLNPDLVVGDSDSEWEYNLFLKNK